MLHAALANIRKHQFRREAHREKNSWLLSHCTQSAIAAVFSNSTPGKGNTHIFSICSQGGNKTTAKDQLLKDTKNLQNLTLH